MTLIKQMYKSQDTPGTSDRRCVSGAGALKMDERDRGLKNKVQRERSGERAQPLTIHSNHN